MEEKKLGLFPLVAAILAGMIGSGVYDIGYQLASVASPGGAILAWIICFVGMLFLVLSLQNLLEKEPEGDGIYIYARKVAGPIGEFMSAWGYWVSGWIGNIAFATIMMIALGTFFPALGDTGASWPAIAIASIVLWGIFFFIRQGVESAMVINSIITILKIVPLAVFVIVTVTSFDFSVFTQDFWTNFAGNAAAAGEGFSLESVFSQATNSMLSIIWLFMGIEYAALMSSRAKSKSIASKASILGLLVGTLLLFVMSMLPYGLYSADELVALGEPCVGKVLVDFIGPVGAGFVGGAMILSIFGSWINYTYGPTESLQTLSEHGLLTERWGRKNAHGVASFSLLITTVLCQLLLITMHFTEDAYNFGFSMSGSAILVTWTFIVLYNFVRAVKNPHEKGRTKNLVIGGIGTLYMLYAMMVSGFAYILLLSIPFAIGLGFYFNARKKAGDEHVFSAKEKIVVAAVILVAIGSAIAYAAGLV